MVQIRFHSVSPYRPGAIRDGCIRRLMNMPWPNENSLALNVWWPNMLMSSRLTEILAHIKIRPCDYHDYNKKAKRAFFRIGNYWFSQLLFKLLKTVLGKYVLSQNSDSLADSEIIAIHLPFITCHFYAIWDFKLTIRLLLSPRNKPAWYGPSNDVE